MNRKMEETQERIVIQLPDGSSQLVRSSRTIISNPEEGGTVRVAVNHGTACANCGHAILKDEDLGGVCLCSPSGEPHIICSECAQRKCAICHAICCDRRGCSFPVGGEKVCTRHRTGEYVRFLLMRGDS